MSYAIVVTGLPGSGKTTLSMALARELELPLISKDLIKESISGGGPASLEESRRLGSLAFQTMYALAALAPQVVLETFFWPGRSEPELLALDRPLVQVHCDCPPEASLQRFLDRSRRGARHPVHHDDAVVWEAISQGGGRLDLPGPCLVVDTSGPVDVPAVAVQVREQLR